MSDKPATQQIDDMISLYGGWKAKTLAHIRTVVRRSAPQATEEVKWKMKNRPEGLPVWSHNGILCMVETFNNDMKLVFPKGAQMSAFKAHFNARLNSKTDRAIEFREGDAVDEAVLTKLVQEAQRLNQLKAGK